LLTSLAKLHPTYLEDFMSSTYRENEHHEEHADDGMVHSHISSFNFYLGIFGTLIFLTIVTVLLSYVHLGQANLAIAIFIASIKAGLVVTFFMHLKYDNKFNAVMFISGLMFIGVFFAYTINDTGRRANELNDATGNKVYLGDPNDKQAPGGFEFKAPVQAAAHSEAHGEGSHIEVGGHAPAGTAGHAPSAEHAPAGHGEPSAKPSH
jgi:cytochrome c oxidase subunit IV